MGRKNVESGAAEPASTKPVAGDSGPGGGADDLTQQFGHRPGLLGRLRNYFFAGILITAPISITIWIAWEFVTFVDSRIRPLIPNDWIPNTYLPFSVPGLGVVIVFVVLTLVGMVTAGLLGRLLTNLGERLVARVPVLRSIYGAIKQIFETVLAQRSRAFREVALIEYPHRGHWALCFVMGRASGEVQRLTEDEVVAVFIPATPNPTTGFLLFLPRQDVRRVDITVEEGLKLVISGGIVVPNRKNGKGEAEPILQLPEKPRLLERGRVRLVTRLRNYFLAGILVTAPAAITFWLTWNFITFVDNRVTPFIPAAWNPESYLPFGIPGLGVVVVAVGMTVIGMVTAGLIGRWLMRAAEWMVARLPIVRSIYSALKQILETVLASRSEAFRECVLFQYPRAGSWAIGFITGRTEGHVQDLTEKHVVNVFLPTTPNPTSGFLIFVPDDEIVPLKMSVEEGLKMVVSGGLVVPPDRDAGATDGEPAADGERDEPQPRALERS
jgi:uncharacterized membrane protein